MKRQRTNSLFNKISILICLLTIFGVFAILPGSVFAQESAEVNVSATVLEQITFLEKNNDLSVTTNSNTHYAVSKSGQYKYITLEF